MGELMKAELIKIDENSSEALYMQLRNQIIMGIASEWICEGDMLPSVRQMAELVGINMHTVNKAYSVLQQEGIVNIGRRGAVICIDADRLCVLAELKEELRRVLVKGICKNITGEEAHQLIDEILEEFGQA